MTDYKTINVTKRSFKVLVQLPVRSATLRTFVLNNDIRVTRNGDIRVTRNGDIRVAHNTTTGYARSISIPKRSFKVLVEVNNG